MRRHRWPDCLWILLPALLLAGPVLDPGRALSVEAGTCEPASRSATHCVLMSLRDPSPERAAALAGKLKAEGLEADAEGESVLAVMSEPALKTLFRARVTYRPVASSAGPGKRCVATLEGVRIPARYRREIQMLAIDHQVCG